MLFIMNVGKIFNGDFGMIYNLVGNNSLLYRTTDVIDTYVYRMLVESTNIGQSAAVSFLSVRDGLYHRYGDQRAHQEAGSGFRIILRKRRFIWQSKYLKPLIRQKIKSK